MKNVLLITPFPPHIGGGGVNIRTLIAGFKAVTVDWRYRGVGHDDACLGDFSIQGSLWERYLEFYKTFQGVLTPNLRAAVERIGAIKADAYWLVVHEEFLPLAVHLRERVGDRIHLSIQDDPPDAIYARSKRYRHVRAIARRHQKKFLRTFASVDVTSVNMQEFYAREYGLASQVVHPVVWSSRFAPDQALPANELRIGHIGSVYTNQEWQIFLRGAESLARTQGRKLVIKVIGKPGVNTQPPRGFGGQIEMLGQMDEAEGITQLSACHAVYAMYPFSETYRVFRETSQPTKLSTYVQAARPIFGHSPRGSSLENFLARFPIGANCASLDVPEIAAALEAVIAQPPSRERFQTALEEEFGSHNAQRLENMLLAVATP